MEETNCGEERDGLGRIYKDGPHLLLPPSPSLIHNSFWKFYNKGKDISNALLGIIFTEANKNTAYKCLQAGRQTTEELINISFMQISVSPPTRIYKRRMVFIA